MNFLLSADLHLRGTRPICRNDEDWLLSQELMIDNIVRIANENKVPLFLTGDIFDTSKVSYDVVVMTVRAFKKSVYGVWLLAGNHDLPYHNYKNVNSSSFGVLRQFFGEIGSPEFVEKFGKVNCNPFGLDDHEDDSEIAFTHQLVFPDDDARPMAKCGLIADELLAKFPHAKWIFTGDYHGSFIHYSDEGRVVVNPGCTNRQKADYIDYRPSVYLVDTEQDDIEKVYLDPEGDVVSTHHITTVKERNERIDAFLEVIKGREGITLSFSDNLQEKLSSTEASKEVKAATQEILQELVDLKQ